MTMMNGPESLSSILAAVGEPGKTLLATLFSLFGIVYIGLPERLLAWRAWWTKQTIGADFIPSAKTVRMYRLFGALVLAAGAALYAGFL